MSDTPEMPQEPEINLGNIMDAIAQLHTDLRAELREDIQNEIHPLATAIGEVQAGLDNLTKKFSNHEHTFTVIMGKPTT